MISSTNGEPPFVEMLNAGFSVIPIKCDGTKKPVLDRWKQYESQRPLPPIALAWQKNQEGIAVIGGRVSGNLEIVDIDEPPLVDAFKTAVEPETPGLLARLTEIRTPRRDEEGRSGLHLYYRCEIEVGGNKKLAMSEPRPQWNEDGTPLIDPKTGKQLWKPETLIETRGEGGYCLTPGCSPVCHPTGNTYDHIAGPPITKLSVITAEERATLHRVAAFFDKSPMGTTTKQRTKKGQATSGETPGNAFNARATWEEILEPHGWTKTTFCHGVQDWLRPGKSIGKSAHTGVISKDGNDLLVCFSQNAHPLEGVNDHGQPGKTYTKFGAYTVLNNDGDFSAAARELVSAQKLV